MKKNRRVGSTSPIEHPPLTDIPEQYGVTSKTEKIVGLTNFHTAKDIAAKINGKIWATVTKDGVVEILYPVG